MFCITYSIYTNWFYAATWLSHEMVRYLAKYNLRRFPVSMLLECMLDNYVYIIKTVMDICILLACTHHIDVLGWCRTRHPLWVWEAWLLINLTRNMGQLNKTLKKSVSQIKKKSTTCCAWQFGLCTYTVNTAWKLSLLFFSLKINQRL